MKRKYLRSGGSLGVIAIGVVTSVAVLPLAGCGESAQVVTVTESVTSAVTETVATESAKTPLTADDQAWVDLIQSQNSAIETLLRQLQAAGQSAGAGQAWTDATTELVGLRADLNRAGIVGVSPCMQRVAVDWESAFSTFEDAFGGAMGGLRGQLTDNAPAQRARRAVQAEMAQCLATIQAPASTTPEDAAAAGSDVDAALAWLDSPPDGSIGPGSETRRALRENMKLSPGNVHVTCKKQSAGYSAVVITGNDKIAASEESGGGFQETSIGVALEGDRVVYVTGGNFVWFPVGQSEVPSGARAALELCGRS